MLRQGHRTIKDIPTLTLVFPYEGEPWGAITPDESALPLVLDWLERAHPEHVDMLRQFVEAATERKDSA